ncbi:MAG: DUF2066 domain-containing protein [Magnetococcales bacterium]|nr:DUF2066 domain-containing protein [Magnetococcales bacterium]
MRFLFLIFLIFSFIPTTGQAESRESIYQVEGVEIFVPNPKPGGRDPRQTGITWAGEKAFDLLMTRMLPRDQREVLAETLKSLGQDTRKYVKRAVVRSEKQRPGGLLFSVDITFSRKAVGEALRGIGLSYNETAHPFSLLLAQMDRTGRPGFFPQGDPFQKALLRSARTFGVSLGKPLGDMEDMVALGGNDAALNQWAKTRYGAKRIFIGQMAFGRVGAGEQEGTEHYAALGTLTVKDTGQRFESRAEGSYAESKGARWALFEKVANELLQGILDRWAQVNAVDPGQQHAVLLRVVHGAKLTGYAKFFKRLKLVSGVSGVRASRFKAREAVLEVDYQGPDDQFMAALMRAGYQVSEAFPEIVIHLP